MQKIALLSFWHVHAADYARETNDDPRAELAVIWDEAPERGRLEAEARGTRFEEDLNAVLSDPEIDAVVITSATTAHHDLITRAAKAGKHIYIEKVIAPTLAESLDIVEKVEAAGVTFSVALARAVEPGAVKTIDLIRSGLIGTPTSARVRVAHDGALPTPDRPDGWLPARFYETAESAGGALIDLGAHPLYLTRLALGMPTTITAFFGAFSERGVDDNTAVLFGYDNGAFGVAETGFVSRGTGFRVEVNGTEGGIVWERGDDHLVVISGRQRSTIALDPDAPTTFVNWLTAIETGASTAANVDLALELSALAEAAAQSGATGAPVALSSLAGWEKLTSRNA